MTFPKYKESVSKSLEELEYTELEGLFYKDIEVGVVQVELEFNNVKFKFTTNDKRTLSITQSRISINQFEEEALGYYQSINN